MAEQLQDSNNLESTTINVYRTATVVKGGRRFSFGGMVVVGDRNGNVGIGYGKAPGVPAAIEKAQKDARKKMHKITLKGGTLPHPVTGVFGSASVRLIPAAPGTGVIAGATVRAVLEMAGVHDCLTKAYGSTNEKNLCKAVLDGLLQLRTREEIARLRQVEIASTTVDDLLAASKKFMSESTDVSGGKKATAPVNTVGQDKKRGGRRGGGGRGRGRADAPPAGEEGSATAVAEAPTEGDAPAPEASAPETPTESNE